MGGVNAETGPRIMRTRPDTIRQLPLPGGRTVAVDEAGYLTDPGDWSRDFALKAAADEGIALTDAHWDLFALMRRWYDEHRVAMDARLAMKYLGEKDGTGKAGGRRKLFEMFPYGYVRQACKIAGMKQPRAWSTG